MVLYFAYGANLHPSVLEGKRKVKPTRSITGYLPDWQLMFNYKGLPFREPVYGNIENIPGTCVHGVVHEVSEDDFQKIIVSEGGGGHSTGYLCKEVEVISYEGEKLKCLTLVCSANNTLDGEYPSARYRNLIIDGSKHHGIKQEYITWLQGLPVHKPNTIAKCLGLLLVTLFSWLYLWIALIRRSFCGFQHTSSCFWKFVSGLLGSVWAGLKLFSPSRFRHECDGKFTHFIQN